MSVLIRAAGLAGILFVGAGDPARVEVQAAVDAPALSQPCRAPAADIAMPAALPHVRAALQGRRPVRVLAIGSSSTAGIGASSPTKTYPAQLEAILESTFRGLEVVMTNSGVPGELAAATAERLKREVASQQPDLVIWQVGTNDALAKVPVEDFRSTVADALRWLKQGSFDTVLVGLQYSPRLAADEHYTAIRRALTDLAAKEHVAMVRRYQAMRHIAKTTAVDILSGDSLHQNDLGYHCMAEHIARAVVVSAFPGGVAKAAPQ
jgi:lysophospholipase L1-like esterase